jgi:hypothetical protein
MCGLEYPLGSTENGELRILLPGHVDKALCADAGTPAALMSARAQGVALRIRPPTAIATTAPESATRVFRAPVDRQLSEALPGQVNEFPLIPALATSALVLQSMTSNGDKSATITAADPKRIVLATLFSW